MVLCSPDSPLNLVRGSTMNFCLFFLSLEANASNKNQNLKLEATGSIATPVIQVLVSISLSLIAYFALGNKMGISLDPETFVAFFTAAGFMAKPI